MTSADQPPRPAAGEAPGTHTSANWANQHTVALLAILIAIVVAGLVLTPAQAFAAIAVLMLGFVTIAGRGVTGLWRGALVDDRNKISLSRLQMALWTVVILAAFLAAALTNIGNVGGANPLAIAIPQQLWLLMGISTTALVASPLIRSTKRDVKPQEKDEKDKENVQAKLTLVARQRGLDPNEVTTRGVEVVNRQPKDARWSDVLQGEEVGNGPHLDLGKVQNLFFTLVLVVAYAAVLVAEFSEGGPVLSLPALDTGMVTLLAISHGGYLAYKATPHTPRAHGNNGGA